MKPASAILECAPGDALAALDRVNTAIVESVSLDDMLRRVLDAALAIFDCERAWVLYPCDASLSEALVRCERVREGWPGAKTAGGRIAITDLNRHFFELCQASDVPVRRDPQTNPMTPENSMAHKEYAVKSMIAMSLWPHGDAPWLLGIHHCREAFVYEKAEPLFHAIGKRIASGLTTFLARRDLEQSEARYRALVDRAAEGIVIFDLDQGTFVDANPAAARIYGHDVDALIGGYGPVPLSPEFQPDGHRSADQAMLYIQAALDGENPTFDWYHLNASGAQVPCQITLGRFPDPSRRLVRASIIDRSEHKRAEQQTAELEARLAQTQKLDAVGQMTGGVAHDFNNLLSVILGNLEMLEEVIDDTDRLDLIDAAIRATHRGADLTHKMLSFARRAHLKPTVLRLNGIVQDMDNWMSRTLPATIDVRVSLQDGLWPVEADRASTESAILNLIINARDAMPNGGMLTIETANVTLDEDEASSRQGDLTPGHYVMLAVSDTGTGIAEDVIGHVFEPFFTTKRPGQGTGLGLSMVHGFMKQSGGTVRIYSEPGNGTTLKLFFRTPVAAPPVAEDPRQPPASVAHRPARILVAEDQDDVMSVLLRILQAAGYAVVPAASGDAARRIYQAEGPFDALVTDIVMPGVLQGPALARVLRELEPDLPVVFMSGYPREASMHGNGLREEDIRLMKPVSRAKLLDAVKQALAQRGG